MTGRPHIVVDALQVTRQPSGLGRAILEYLTALADSGHEFRFTVLASQPEGFEFLGGRQDWQVHLCPAAEGSVVRKAAFTQWGLPRLLNRLGADLLHSLQLVTPQRSPCPTVVTVHDLVWRLYAEGIEQPRRSYYRVMVPRSLKAAAAILANSQSTARDVKRCLPGVVGRTLVAPFGTPTWLRRYPAEAVAAQSVTRPFFLFVGTLEPRRNLANVLGAFARFLSGLAAQGVAPEQWPRLLLVGAAGWRTRGLDRLLAAFPYPDHLEWRHYVPPEELAVLYHQAIALVFPSLYEGFGFPVLEAMSVGLPVMTSGRGALAEVAGEAALLVDPLDQGQMARTLHRLYMDGELRARLAAGGPERSAEWTWQQTVAVCLPVYQQLIEAAAGGGGLKK